MFNVPTLNFIGLSVCPLLEETLCPLDYTTFAFTTDLQKADPKGHGIAHQYT